MPCIPIKDLDVIEKMRVSLAERDFKYGIFFELGLSTGCRVSDLLALRKKDIKFGVVYFKTKKTGQLRGIGLNDSIRKKLEVYLEDKKDDDLVFGFTRQWAHKLLKAAAKEAGYDPDLVSCHTTRKTAAWRFYEASGKDAFKTMEFLGHRSPTETRRYLGISEQEVNEVNVEILWS